jgi:hypothetical protein
MVNTASGPDEWVASLGATRVMLGFVFAGGRREGSLIRAMRVKGRASPFGEANGATTERLRKLVNIFNHAHPQARVRYLCPRSFPRRYADARECDTRNHRCGSRNRPPNRSCQCSDSLCSAATRCGENLSCTSVLQSWRNRRWLALLASAGRDAPTCQRTQGACGKKRCFGARSKSASCRSVSFHAVSASVTHRWKLSMKDGLNNRTHKSLSGT